MLRLRFAAAFAAAALLSGRLRAQPAESEVPAAVPTLAARAASPGPFQWIGREATIYWDDAKALFFAPLHWDGGQIATAVGAGAVVGGVMIVDERLAQGAQDHASAQTRRLSRIVTPLGDWAAWGTSGVLVVSGLALRDTHVSAMGREAVEACVFASLMTDILKPVFGRVRPYVSGNENSYQPLTHNYSFPSGHATVAFAFASVISARSEGWVIPTASYTLASLVAYSRVNDAQHFPSDVVAGGLIGTVVGRFIVHRHLAAEGGGATPPVAVDIFPIRNGLGVSARF